jgi:uncharacterized RDD family membrane protein YckC
VSTASPLPLQPLPSSTLSETESRALKQQVSNRLMEHRQRRPRLDLQPDLPMPGMPSPQRNRVADQVAARFAKSVSYREFLQGEAESAVRKAEATAEVARRNADAIAAVQGELLAEIEQWEAESPVGPVEVLSPLQAIAAAATEPAVAPTHVHARQEVNSQSQATSGFAMSPQVQAFVAELQANAEPSLPLPANLIEFPRQLVAARRARPRLAEGPLRDEADASPERAQLRIFEVEASSVSTEPVTETVVPEWHSLRLDAPAAARITEHADAQISFALPVQVAPVSLRMMAALVDGCCIAAGWLAAIAAIAYVSTEIPTGLPALGAAAGMLAFFALLYKVLFFSLGDATPGMRYARIGLCTFSDENPTRSSMRRRMLAVLLAGLPLGLGLAWVLLDEEGLGWHDRISRMYPRAY